MSATGRQSQPVRGSKLMGAQVKDSSGSQIGQIEDIIASPASGRIDFAVISLSSSGTTTSTSSSTSSADRSTSGIADTTSMGSTSGKLVAVPWSLLKTDYSGSSSGTTSSGTYSQSSSSIEQPSFTLTTVDQSKLQQAPTFSWTDLSQSTWRQRTYAYFGVSTSESTGSAESPSGSVRGEGARKHLEDTSQPSPERP